MVKGRLLQISSQKPAACHARIKENPNGEGSGACLVCMSMESSQPSLDNDRALEGRMTSLSGRRGRFYLFFQMGSWQGRTFSPHLGRQRS